AQVRAEAVCTPVLVEELPHPEGVVAEAELGHVLRHRARSLYPGAAPIVNDRGVVLSSHRGCPEDSSAILPPGRGGRYDPTMQRSDTRVLTTHAGSLPRPPALVDMYVRLSRREPIDAAALAAAAEESTRRTVRQQLEVGI